MGLARATDRRQAVHASGDQILDEALQVFFVDPSTGIKWRVDDGKDAAQIRRLTIQNQPPPLRLGSR